MDRLLIVGAGPVGLTLALELSRHGIPVRLIDKKAVPCDESRAAGVHARTLELLDRSGVAEALIEAGVPLSGMNLYQEGKSLLSLDFKEFQSPFPFVLGLGQNRTERILAERLAQFGVEVERETELLTFAERKGCIEVTLKKKDGQLEHATTALLFGCDGAHSRVRKGSGLTFEGGSYPQLFMLADVAVHWPYPQDRATGFFDQHGGMFTIPIDREGGYRLVFPFFDETHYQENLDARGGVVPPTFQDLERLCHHFCPQEMVISEPKWLTTFRIHHRIVTTYRKGRAILLGDAAHVHSPIGAQGMNTGIQDAINLAWKVALVMKGSGRPELLDTFTDERHRVGKAVVQGADKATRLFTTPSALVQSVRNRLGSFLSRIPAFRAKAIGMLSETAVNYRHSPIVTYRSKGKLRGGDRLPDASSLKLGDRSLTLYHLLDLTRFDLLIFTGRKPTQAQLDDLVRLKVKFEAAYGEHVVCHIVAAPSVVVAYAVVDQELMAHTRCGITKPTLVLVRPDGYLSMIGLPTMESVESNLKHMLI